MVFRAKIANYVSHGDKNTELPGGGWVKNIIDFEISNYKCSSVIYPEVLQSNKTDVKGEFIPSGEITIDGIKTTEEGESVISDICRLLTLGTMSQVIWYSYEFKDGSRLGKRINTNGFYNSWRPLLQFEAPLQTKDFLEKCWTPYQVLKSKRKLHAVIEYLVQCDRPNQFLEVKMLFTCIILENLKSTYAHNKGYQFDGRRFISQNKTKHFKEILEEMFCEVGMVIHLDHIIHMRNEVVHNGLSESSYDHIWSVYESAQDVIREYLLRLLEYKGYFWIYSTACRDMKKL